MRAVKRKPASAKIDSNLVNGDVSKGELGGRPSDYPLTKAEVIVVDDDGAVRQRLRAMLEWAGYSVQTAASGEQALGLMNSRFCPLLLTDSVMPGMSGLDLCRTVRESTFERYVYTIILSVQDDSEDVLRGLAAGADDYVSKRAPKFEILARMRTGRRIVAMADGLREIATTARRGTYHDTLTMTFNRRYLSEGLRREVDRARRYRHSLSLIACEVGDRPLESKGEGSKAADEILQEFVGRLRTVLRDGCDWIARSGDNTFVVVLPETSIEGACRVGEKILRQMAVSPFGTGADAAGVMVQLGITGTSSATLRRFASCEHLLDFADRCLKRSRFMGPGQYCAAAFDPRELKADEATRSPGSARNIAPVSLVDAEPPVEP